MLKKVYKKVLSEMIKPFEFVATYRRASTNYDRVYHIHLRKTGGTSLNHSFFEGFVGADTQNIYKTINQKFNHRLRFADGTVIQGWDPRRIELGLYTYAFSHQPFHKLHLPPNTFRVTCLREPLSRTISLYNMLKEMRLNDVKHPGMKEQSKWVRGDFSYFLENIPKSELHSQLFNFSEKYDLNEAVDNILSIEQVMLTEQFSEGIRLLNHKLGTNLLVRHIRKTTHKTELTESELSYAKEVLRAETEFYDTVKTELTVK